MLIDLEHDELHPVARLIHQRTGKRSPPQQIWRYRVKGCRGVKLECVLVGSTWHTTKKAWAAFVAGQTAAAESECTAAGHEAGERAAGHEAAERDPATERRLRKAGLIAESAEPAPERDPATERRLRRAGLIDE